MEIPSLYSLSPFHTHNISSVGGENYSLPFYIFIISFTINQHVFPKLCFVTHWINFFSIYTDMIHNINKMISNIHWWFIISNACILLNLIYCRKNKSKKSEYCNHKNQHLLYLWLSPKTDHKKNWCHSCISNPGMIYYYIPSSCEAELQSQKF